MLYNIFVVQPKGLDRIWIIGDEFAYGSFHQYYHDNRHEGRPMTYAFQRYEVKEYLSTKFSNNKSSLSRICNNLIAAINSYETTPKVVVVVLDGDVLKGVHSNDDLTMTIHIGRITEWLVREFFRAIESFKDYLPEKSKRPGQPHILWISPPTHTYFTANNNVRRTIQANCLKTVIQLYQNMTVLEMLKFWDYQDGNAVLFDSTRYTADGLSKYWQSVDAALRFWDVALFPKIGSTSKNKQKNKSKYHWKNNNL